MGSGKKKKPAKRNIKFAKRFNMGGSGLSAPGTTAAPQQNSGAKSSILDKKPEVKILEGQERQSTPTTTATSVASSEQLKKSPAPKTLEAPSKPNIKLEFSKAQSFADSNQWIRYPPVLHEIL